MSLRTRVKVGNVSSLSEARYCAGMGVDMLGFRVGQDGLNAATYKEIIDWVSGPEFVLEAHLNHDVTLDQVTNEFPGHYVEIGKHQLHWLGSEKLSFILAIRAADWSDLAAKVKGMKNLKYVEIEGKVTMEQLQSITLTNPVLLKVDDMSAVSGALEKPIAGIALSGSQEQRPGLMDYGFVSEVLEALDVE